MTKETIVGFIPHTFHVRPASNGIMPILLSDLKPEMQSLIAAAPDLLEACKEAVNDLDGNGIEYVEKMKLAIAKAEGKQ